MRKMPEVGSRPEAEQQHRPDAGDGHAGAHDHRRAEPMDDPRRDHRTGDETQRRWKRPHGRLDRRQPEHELQVLPDEQEVADDDEDAEEVRAERGAECPDAEEADVDHRRLEVQLTTHEDEPEQHARDDREHRHRRDPILRDLLEPVDHAQDGEQRHRGAGEVQAASLGVPILGQGARAKDQQEHHDRDTDQEHRAPPEELEEEAAEHRSDRPAGGVRRDPEPDRGRALLRIEEHREDQRQRRRRDGRAGDPHDGSAGDEHLRALREGGEQRRQREERGTAQEELPAADPIPEGAHRDEQAGDEEAVDVDDPQQLRARRSQLCADSWDGEVEHGQVHRVDERREGEHAEPDPLPPRRPRRHRVRACQFIHALSDCHSRRNSSRERSQVRIGDPDAAGSAAILQRGR